MMLFFNANDPVGQIHAAEFAELGKKHSIPTFNDAAADVPPVENLLEVHQDGLRPGDRSQAARESAVRKAPACCWAARI